MTNINSKQSIVVSMMVLILGIAILPETAFAQESDAQILENKAPQKVDEFGSPILEQAPSTTAVDDNKPSGIRTPTSAGGRVILSEEEEKAISNTTEKKSNRSVLYGLAAGLLLVIAIFAAIKLHHQFSNKKDS